MNAHKIFHFFAIASLAYLDFPLLSAQSTQPESKAIKISQPADEVYWDTYTSLSNQPSIADDVTNLIQVNDIKEKTVDYIYASFGKDDPFIPPIITNQLATIEIPIVSLLQKYRLDQLQVVGIWTLDNNERKALVMSPKDEGVIVRVGDPAGNRGGKVISIEPDIVTVREFTLAPDGSRLFEDHELWLGDEAPVAEEKTLVISAQHASFDVDNKDDDANELEQLKENQQEDNSLSKISVPASTRGALSPSPAMPQNLEEINALSPKEVTSYLPLPNEKGADPTSEQGGLNVDQAAKLTSPRK